jgi:hypothetical protein
VTFVEFHSDPEFYSGYVTNNKCGKMQYENYDIAIKLQYGVDLVSFPGVIRNPSKIGNIADLQVIRDKLRSGACKWVKMSREDRVTWAEKMQGRGGRQRAVCSDLGTKRPWKHTLTESSRAQGTRNDRRDTDSNDNDSSDSDGDNSSNSEPKTR